MTTEARERAIAFLSSQGITINIAQLLDGECVYLDRLLAAHEAHILASRPRMQFVQDDSCHWYLIPAGERDNFNNWVAAMENYGADYIGKDYDQHRIDGHPSHYFVVDAVKETL